MSDEGSTDEEGEDDLQGELYVSSWNVHLNDLLQDPFIDTAAGDGEEIFYDSLRDDENEEATDALFEDLLSRAYLNAAGSSGSSDMDARHRYTDPDLVFVFDNDDLPLWKVSCEVCEIRSSVNVIFSVLHRSDTKRESYQLCH